MQNRYQALEEESPDGEEEDEIVKEFHIMEEAYMKTADEVLGRPRKKRKPWITEESWALVDQREEINKKILSTRSERIKKRLRTEYKEKSKEVIKSTMCNDCFFFGSGNELLNSENELLINEDLSNRNAV